MRLAIAHTTTYRYGTPIVFALQQLRLAPQSGTGQRVLAWQTEVQGGAIELTYKDQHLNLVELVAVAKGATEVHLTSSGEVETTDTAGVLPKHDGYTPLWLFSRSTALTNPGEGVGALAAAFDPGGDKVSQLHELSANVLDRVEYTVGATASASSAEDALARGAGVCQDHAHVFVAAARALGWSARYVSGYLMMNDRVEQDATHAWAEVWVDGLGWVGFDVSNGISPDERYVRIATGLDYRDAAPVSGMRLGPGGEFLEVSVQVRQQHQSQQQSQHQEQQSQHQEQQG